MRKCEVKCRLGYGVVAGHDRRAYSGIFVRAITLIFADAGGAGAGGELQKLRLMKWAAYFQFHGAPLIVVQLSGLPFNLI